MNLKLSTDDLFGSAIASFGSDAWLTIAVIISAIVAIIGYLLFVRPNNKYGSKFANWLKDFLNFDELVIEPVIKILYIFVTLFIIFSSFSIIEYSFRSFITYLLFGLVATRISYELIMLLVGIYKNTKNRL